MSRFYLRNLRNVNFNRKRRAGMFNIKKHLCLVAFFLAIMFVISTGPGCSKREKYAGPPEKITIAYSTASNAVLVYIAFAKDYFRDEGLDAIQQPHPFGKPALKAVIDGKADIATVGDTPIVFAILSGEKIATIAIIQTSNKNEAIFARRDRGITQASDLKGKKIGLTLGTTGDFFADSFLLGHGVDRKDVKFINMVPDEMAGALASGKVDAVSTWNPILIQLKKKFGNKGTILFGESLYTELFCVAAREEYVKKNPLMIRKVLRALIKAESFAQQHPEESRRLVADFIKTDKALLDEVWDIFTLQVALDQTLIADFEDQTRWAVKYRSTIHREIPNYLDFIYVEGLQAVKPEAVRIIR
jgi:ABC-type nitrate/sulfonate/bicarbonate transport system substrate-binding protein